MINKIIATVSSVLKTKISENTIQKNCDKWDSLMHINIIIALEDAFDLSFEPEEIAQMTGINAIQQIISKKQDIEI